MKRVKEMVHILITEWVSKQFKKKIIILGVIKISTVTMETVDIILDRINEALKYIEYDRLWYPQIVVWVCYLLK